MRNGSGVYAYQTLYKYYTPIPKKKTIYKNSVKLFLASSIASLRKHIRTPVKFSVCVSEDQDKRFFEWDFFLISPFPTCIFFYDVL